jgi:hypothetical protein
MTFDGYGPSILPATMLSRTCATNSPPCTSRISPSGASAWSLADSASPPPRCAPSTPCLHRRREERRRHVPDGVYIPGQHHFCNSRGVPPHQVPRGDRRDSLRRDRPFAVGRAAGRARRRGGRNARVDERFSFARALDHLPAPRDQGRRHHPRGACATVCAARSSHRVDH